MLIIGKFLISLFITMAADSIEPPPPPEVQTPTYAGTLTQGGSQYTNINPMTPTDQSASNGTSSQSTTQAQTPSNPPQPPKPDATPNSTTPSQVPPQTVSPSQGTPSGAAQNDQACSALTKPAHISFASRLDGNELVLFCSIFDDAQRDQAIAYTLQSPPLAPKDAVVQVGKDAGLLFSQTPGGACGAH